MSAATKSTKRTYESAKANKVFSAEEQAAMVERAKESKAEKRRGAAKPDGEADALAKIAEMPPSDRAMAERFHALVKDVAPALSPKTWYGMPAYANEEGKIVCFFTPAAKFNERYATFGFNPTANLDDGNMWPTGFALLKLTPTEETRIADLLKRAVSESRSGSRA